MMKSKILIRINIYNLLIFQLLIMNFTKIATIYNKIYQITYQWIMKLMISSQMMNQ